MVKPLQNLSRWLAAHASLFIIAIAVITFFVPELFSWVRGTTQTVILGIIMLTMGLTLTTSDFRILAHRPLDILIGACAQFLIMPCVAWMLVRVFHLEPALALGILLVGCCPGGVSSNIMSFLCHGDVAFSVGMTCASTLLAPVMTPLLMELTAGQIIEIDAIGMFLNILIVTIIPVGIGCFLNYTYAKRKVFPTLQSLMPGVSVIALACIVGGVISTVHDDLVSRGLTLFLWTFAVVFCHNSLGYLLGWAAGRLARFNSAKKRTLSIEVGMQNAGLATVLAGTFFAAQPLAVLPCAISCAWHSISGTILAGLFLRLEKRRTNKYALFFDIDGTLVSFKTHQIPDSAIEALTQAKANGHKVFIATGRPPIIITNLGSIEHLIDGYVTTNGALCYVGSHVVVCKAIPEAEARLLVDDAVSKSYGLIVVGERDVAVLDPQGDVDRIFRQELAVENLDKAQPLEVVMQQRILQMTPFFPERYEQELMSRLPNCVAGRWHPEFVDITGSGADKGKGVLAMANYLGMDPHNTIAFGDGGNDISMIRTAGIGIAMGNANEQLKQEADYVTTAVDDNGVSNALRHFGVTSLDPALP